jgi:hypothetical protein
MFPSTRSVYCFMYVAFFLIDVSPFPAPYNNEYPFVLYITALPLLQDKRSCGSAYTASNDGLSAE